MSVVGFAKERYAAGGEYGDKGVRTYRREFVVEVDSKYDKAQVVLGAPGLPQRYWPYVTLVETDYYALCTRLTASRMAEMSAFHWLVEAEYSTIQGDEDKEKEVDNPLAEPADVSVSFETFREPVTGVPDDQYADDENGFAGKMVKAIVNSAGEPFDPPAERDAARPILTIARNEAFFNTQLAIAYVNAVNSDMFFGAKARCARVNGIDGQRQFKSGLKFWRVTYTIGFKPETWDLQLLDHGSYYFDADAKKQHFRDEDGNRITGLLNGNPALGDKLPANADPKFLRFKVYAELPFAILQLPQTVDR